MLAMQEPAIRGVVVDASLKLQASSLKLSKERDDGLLVVNHDRYDVMRHADCACAVSGTVTAELAILGVPMVVCYHLPWLSRVLARALVRIPLFALPNILAGTRLVPEMLEPEPQALARTLLLLTRDSDERRGQLAGLARVAAELGPPGAMQRVCMLALDRTRGKWKGEMTKGGGQRGNVEGRRTGT